MKYLLLLVALVPVLVLAQTKTVTWDHPTSRVPAPVATQVPVATPAPGQTPLPTLTPFPENTGVPLLPGELKESRLYNKRVLQKVIPHPTNVASVTVQSNQNYAWEVTAVDKTGVQSGYSNALVFQAVPVPTLAWPPGEPGSLRTK